MLDYELRRKLLRANKTNSVRKLDGLKAILRFLPITSAAMLLAADLWASFWQRGLATTDPKKLDVDVILAAQALTVAPKDLIVATSNAALVSRFVRAVSRDNIIPP